MPRRRSQPIPTQITRRRSTSSTSCKGLDETRFAGAAHRPRRYSRAVKKQPGRMMARRRSGAPMRPSRTDVGIRPPDVGRVADEASLIVTPGLANATNPDSLGSVAARALAEKVEEQREPEELLAPEFMRAHRVPIQSCISTEWARRQSAGAGHAERFGRALCGQGLDDEEVLIMGLQRTHSKGKPGDPYTARLGAVLINSQLINV